VVTTLAALGLAIAPARAANRVPVRGAALGFVRQTGKLSPRLEALASPLAHASPRAQAASLSLPAGGPGSLERRPGGRVLVEIRTASTSATTVARLRALGAHVVNVSPAYSTVTAAVADSALGAVAADPDVTAVNEVLQPMIAGAGASARSAGPALSGCTPTISEGDSLMHVATARATHNVDGAGQTIGLLSDSFDTAVSAPTHAATDIATGDLPGPGNPCGYTTPVTVQSDYSGGGQTDEGRAMTELAHGLAPAANLAFATASNGELDFASQITKLRTVNHATVIVDDVTYFDEPFFQDGPIAVAANASSAAGVPYFSAAGNSNLTVGGKNVTSYETPAFRSTACPPTVTAIEPLIGCHNFDPNGGVGNSDAITLAPGGGFGLDLQWAQPWGAVTNDYDVFLLNSTGTVIAGSGTNQASSKKPFEFFGYTNATASPETVRIVIGKYSGGPDSRMKFVMFGASGVTSVQYDTSTGGDIVGPTIFGHNGAALVGSTAAIPYNDPTTPEYYSSRGPVTLYYQPTPSTAALGSPQVLDKPDFAATDNVQNVFFAYPGGGVFRFPGTSAAAPQAAAIGALLLQFDPALTSAQVMSTLRSSGQAVANNGTLDDVGGGYLDANAALGAVSALPGAPRILSQTNGNARAALEWAAAKENPNFPVTGYQVTPSLNGVPQPAIVLNSPATSHVLTGLVNGGFYTFTVTAVDTNGSGPPSDPSPQIVIGRPGKAASVTAMPGNGRATIKWKAPSLTYGLKIVSYEVGIFVNSAIVSSQTFKSPATTQTVKGLKNGHTYTFEVFASNGTSSGPFSDASPPVIVGAPGPPTGVHAVSPKHTTARVHWTAPPDNASPITAYVVTPYIGTVAKAAQVFHSKATTQTIVLLKAGQHYTFRIAAVNARGSGPKSSPSNVVTAI
jgi:hypothetical protein